MSGICLSQLATILAGRIRAILDCREIFIFYRNAGLFVQVEARMIGATEMLGLLECEYFDIRSDIVGDTFRIFVAKPPFVPEGNYPVLYLTDGNATFSTAMGIQRTLAWGGEAPPTYVVAIGYPTESGYMAAISKRHRDYLPPNTIDDAKALLGESLQEGAEAFANFIQRELNPELSRRYKINTSDRTVYGSSLGALFGLWILLTRPQDFNRYILASPAIAAATSQLVKWEADSSVLHDPNVRVYLTAGEFEAAEASRRNALDVALRNPMLRPMIEQMIAGLDARGWHSTLDLTVEFATRLKSRSTNPSLIRCETLAAETHISAASIALSRGLQFVFKS
jgi:predicted alpha/beta superfamily hydrolase